MVPSVVIASGVVIWQVVAVKPVSEHPSGPQPIVSPVSETVLVVLSVSVEVPVSCVIERETVQPVEGDPPLSSLAVIGSVVVFEPPSATLKGAGLLAVTDNTPGITSVVIVGHCSVTPGLQAAAQATRLGYNQTQTALRRLAPGAGQQLPL